MDDQPPAQSGGAGAGDPAPPSSPNKTDLEKLAAARGWEKDGTTTLWLEYVGKRDENEHKIKLQVNRHKLYLQVLQTCGPIAVIAIIIFACPENAREPFYRELGKILAGLTALFGEG